MHPVLPEAYANDEKLKEEFASLRTALCLNSALCALKLDPPKMDLAKAMADGVIARLGSASESTWGTLPERTKADLAKAHFRRALV